MPLVSMTEQLAHASTGGYAVAYCESWDLDSFQAVLQAAAEMQAPMIAGFNGGFLGSRSLAAYAGLGLAIRESPVPVSFLLNETDDFAQIEQGLRLGFNAVMVDNDHLPFDDYRRLVRRVVALAHPLNVAVEAQVGRLPSGAEPGSGEVTDPALARAFVAETGVDALAVAVGNVHILTEGTSPIDFDALARIRDQVRIPLVFHGGTGLPPECFARAISLGVVKFNFGTVLKQAYLAALATALQAYHPPMSPHPFLGMGGPQDILMAARAAVTAQVRDILTRTANRSVSQD